MKNLMCTVDSDFLLTGGKMGELIRFNIETQKSVC